MGSRFSAISSIRRTSSTSTTSIRTRRKAAAWSTIGTAARITFDSFNHFILKGDAGAGARYSVRHADGARAATSPMPSMASSRKSRRRRARPHVGDLQAAPRGEVRRRLAADRRRRRLLVHRPEGEGPPRSSRCALRDVVKAEALDPQTVRYTFKGDLDSRPARSSSRSCRCCRRPTTPTQPVRRDLARARRSAPGPTRSPTSSPAPHHLQTPARLLGEGSARQSRPVQFRRAPLRVLPRPHDRARRRSRPATSTCARSSRALDWATSYDIPAVNDGRLIRLVLPDERPSGAQGFFINTRREQVQGPARARSARSRVRFRMVEQEPVLRALQAHARATSKIPT